MDSLEKILSNGAEFVKKEFMLPVPKIEIKHYSEESWKIFCENSGISSSINSIYLPNDNSAHIKDNPEVAGDVFREVFGYGLFCEYAIPGMILREELRRGNLEGYMDSPRNSVFGITGYNITDYKGFALWMESIICTETGNDKIWEKRKENFNEYQINLWSAFKSAEENLTRFGLMSQMGFPKIYDSKKVVDVVRKFYGTEFDNIDMIILYCSKKPYSDIDLLVLSKNQCRSRSNGWLDITEINNGEFIEKLQRLDIAVTDPLFSGEVIYGNKDTCNRLKNIALNIPITQESIAYNTKMASIQLKNYEEETNPELGNIYKSYNRSYMFNAISLSQGVKLLTLKGIEGEYGRYKSKETSQ